MPLRLQRLLWLLAVPGSLGWLAWFLGPWAPAGEVSPALALMPLWLLLLHPAALLAEMALAARVHGADPTSPPAARARATTALREAWLAWRLFGWRQPWRSNDWPDRPEGAGSVGVVLVHGYLCNRALWRDWSEWLTARSVPFVALDLGRTWIDIDAHAPALERAVARLVHGTGRTPVLVAHSMGGLVIRAWWRWRARRRGAGEDSGLVPVDDTPRVLSLATPHCGTWMARWGGPASVRQMAPGSAWLSALAAGEDATFRSRFTCVRSNCDNVVFPPALALLPGAQALHWPGLGHLELVHDPRGRALLAGWLDEAQLSCPRRATGAGPTGSTG